jgi:hypothetical protein
MDKGNAEKLILLKHSALQLIPLPAETFEHTRNRRVVDRPMLGVGQQILLANIGDVTVLRIFGEQVVKWLVFGRTHAFRNRLIPLVAVGENGIDVENDAAKIEDAVAHDVADRKGRFGDVGGKGRVVHSANIGSFVVQINLALGKAKNIGYWPRSATGARRFSGTDQPLRHAERWLSGRKHRTRNAACR